jgi:hypothetical protein
MTEETKRCTKCKKEFPKTREFFYKRSASKDGLQPHCKNCQLEISRQQKKGRGRYFWYISYIKRRYGLLEENLRDLMDSQKGCCWICQKSLINPERNSNSMHIDHCHKTNKVRGLLCGVCNTRIGLVFEKRGDWYYKAQEYLSREPPVFT